MGAPVSRIRGLLDPRSGIPRPCGYVCQANQLALVPGCHRPAGSVAAWCVGLSACGAGCPADCGSSGHPFRRGVVPGDPHATDLRVCRSHWAGDNGSGCPCLSRGIGAGKREKTRLPCSRRHCAVIPGSLYKVGRGYVAPAGWQRVGQGRRGTRASVERETVEPSDNVSRGYPARRSTDLVGWLSAKPIDTRADAPAWKGINCP